MAVVVVLISLLIHRAGVILVAGAILFLLQVHKARPLNAAEAAAGRVTGVDAGHANLYHL